MAKAKAVKTKAENKKVSGKKPGEFETMSPEDAAEYQHATTNDLHDVRARLLNKYLVK